MDININKILNGTDYKKIVNGYDKLKTNFSKSASYEYFLIYENMPLSSILKCSRFIFADPFSGYNFYINKIINHVPLNLIETEQIKVKLYLDEFRFKMSNDQIKMYEHIIEIFDNILEKYANTINLYKNFMDINFTKSDDIKKCIDLYDLSYEYCKSKSNDILNQLDNIISTCDNPYGLIDILYIVTVNIPDLHASVFRYLKNIYFDNPNTPKEYEKTVTTMNILTRILLDRTMVHNIKLLPNENLKNKLFIASSNETEDVIKSIVTQKADDTEIIYSNPVNSVNKVFDDHFFDEIYEEDNKNKKLDVLKKQKEVIDTEAQFMLFDFLTSTDEELDEAYQLALADYYIGENAMPNKRMRLDYLINLSSMLDNEIAVLEFTTGGEQPRIVGREMGKFNENNHNHDNQKTNKTVNNNISKPINKKLDDDEDPDIDDKVLSDMEDDLDKELNESVYWDSMGYYVSEEVAKKAEIPKKPKQKITSKIQAAGLDADAKMKTLSSKGGKVAQDVKNSAKALAKIPSGIVNSIKKQINTWDDMDDDKRKEFILKPGFRKNYFRLFRLALTHYVAFAINPLLNIVVFIATKLGKEKDKRITNELNSELSTEIKICEEKINDASAKGDNKQKYQLMRIRDKLEAERVRIRTNSRYI